MKLTRRQLEIEFEAENDFERQAIAELLRHRQLEVKYGQSTDRSWPPARTKTNLVLVLPDPNKW